MIPANELRIGNYVNHKSEGISRVTEIESHKNQIGVTPLSFNNYVFMCAEINPIPLTPEIMVKNFGFKQEGEEFSMTGWCGYRHWLIYLDGCFYLTNSERDGFHYVKAYRYVHEIQNLFFALAGFEAKLIKPL